jgi:hypothetical protein
MVSASICMKLPLELVDRIINYLRTHPVPTLHACACVHSSWTGPSQRVLFQTVQIIDAKTLCRLIRTLNRSPHIIPFIKCVAVKGDLIHGRFMASESLFTRRPPVIEETKLFARLSSLLPKLRSLELNSFTFDQVDHEFGRTHFLGVTHLKLTRVHCRSLPLESNLLAPRQKLNSLEFHDVLMKPSPAHTLSLSRYRELELGQSTSDLIIASIAELHRPSKIERLNVAFAGHKSFPLLCTALQAVGPSLQTLQLSAGSLNLSNYADLMPRLLESNTRLRHLEWIHTITSFSCSFHNMCSILTPVFAHVGSRVIDSITLDFTVFPPAPGTAVTASADWEGLANVLEGDVFSNLQLFKICLTFVSPPLGPLQNPRALFGLAFPRLLARNALQVEIHDFMPRKSAW